MKFSKEARQIAKEKNLTLASIKIDERHLGKSMFEISGVITEEVRELLMKALSEWRRVDL